MYKPKPIANFVKQHTGKPIRSATGKGCQKDTCWMRGKDHKCWLCHDMKWLRFDVGVDSPLFGEVTRCPNCIDGTRVSAQSQREQSIREYTERESVFERDEVGAFETE